LLRQNKLLPLPVLFTVDATSPYYHEENKGSIFYAESWALTHYLYTKDRQQKDTAVGRLHRAAGQQGRSGHRRTARSAISSNCSRISKPTFVKAGFNISNWRLPPALTTQPSPHEP